MNYYYQRTIADKIKKDFFQGRTIIILGARRVSKSTLVKTILNDFSVKHSIAFFNGDDPDHVGFLEFQTIKNPQVLRQLLKALAIQVGELISTNELANLLGVSKNTVVNYIDLLEKSFVIFRLPSFSKNKRREIKKAQKIYFWDIGVRKQLAGNLSLASKRVDIGQVWENFVMAERLKHQFYSDQDVSPHFWRSYDGNEVDYVEKLEDKLYGFEIKWSSKKPDHRGNG